jgi:hypothetical protein
MISDIPFRWKRENYAGGENVMLQLFNRKNHKKKVAADVKGGGYDMKGMDLKKKAGMKPLFWAFSGGLALLALYFLILSVANSFNHAIEQFIDLWPWVSALVIGFGIQAGLYSHIRHEIRQRKSSAAATSSVAAAGGISTTSMVACCAHHVTDVLPILGISAAVVFLNQFQDLFLTIGVMSNLVGMTLMLRIIQKHHLFSTGNGILSRLMKIDMTRSLYVVSTFSAFLIIVTLFRSI